MAVVGHRVPDGENESRQNRWEVNGVPTRHVVGRPKTIKNLAVSLRQLYYIWIGGFFFLNFLFSLGAQFESNALRHSFIIILMSDRVVNVYLMPQLLNYQIIIIIIII